METAESKTCVVDIKIAQQTRCAVCWYCGLPRNKWDFLICREPQSAQLPSKMTTVISNLGQISLVSMLGQPKHPLDQKADSQMLLGKPVIFIYPQISGQYKWSPLYHHSKPEVVIDPVSSTGFHGWSKIWSWVDWLFIPSVCFMFYNQSPYVNTFITNLFFNICSYQIYI